ncbi:carbon monoxide dehydrogenase subunit G [Aureimonas sp. ME7]|uniref:CoxG family protein n=1 Tax=Aureimonas sp. ME7 TaxID=2744252 RepID=UPI0015F3C053|nr:carbon monoxide dehydrogenase subunit G [Aureimonas sp. ME7]
MELRGEYRLAASRETVWTRLNDPATLREAIPGCEMLEVTAENRMAVRVGIKLGFWTARFSGEMHLEDIHPPERWSIVGEGQGGIAGFAAGRADIRLADEGDETVLHYRVTAETGGRIAELGGRWVEAAGAKLVERFLKRLAEQVENGSPATAGD